MVSDGSNGDAEPFRIVVDEERCILSGECIYNHPGYFAWSADETVAVVTRADIVCDDDRRHADEAVAQCPGGAISIIDTPTDT